MRIGETKSCGRRLSEFGGLNAFIALKAESNLKMSIDTPDFFPSSADEMDARKFILLIADNEGVENFMECVRSDYLLENNFINEENVIR